MAKSEGNKGDTSTEATIKTSFKINRDIHLALKQYAIAIDKHMDEVVFEDVLKPFLEEKGFYPPRKIN